MAASGTGATSLVRSVDNQIIGDIERTGRCRWHKAYADLRNTALCLGKLTAAPILADDAGAVKSVLVPRTSGREFERSLVTRHASFQLKDSPASFIMRKQVIEQASF